MSAKKTKALEIKRFLLDMIADARKECRELTPEEEKLFDEQKNELIALGESIKATEDKLDELEDSLPELEEKAEDEEEKPAEETPPEEQPAEEPGEEKPAEEPQEAPAEEGEQPAAEPEEEKPAEDEEEKSEEDAEQINKEEEKPEAESTPEETEEEEEPEKEKDNKRFNKMSKFSLLKAVRSAAFGGQNDELTSAILNEGMKDFRNAGINVTGQITLPGEARTMTITDEHDEVVKEDWQPLLLPLFKNKVLDNAHHLTGLVGDIRIPQISELDCNWEGEISRNKETSAQFDHIVMKPHRISTTIYLSKQFLMQESVGAESTIRELLVEALAQKLESTFLSKNAAAGNVPAGIFAGKTATKVTNFPELCDFEAQAVENCYNLDAMRYLMDPKSWSTVRGTFTYGGKSTRMVMEGKEIDGRPYDVTQNLDAKEFALIDWSNVYIGQWAGTEISVDGTSVEMARTAQVAITLNAWFDCLVVRDEAVQLATVDKNAETLDPSTND